MLLRLGILLLASTLLTVSAGEPARSELYPQTKKQLSALIQKRLRKGQFQALSIALVDADSLIWAAGFGYADPEKKIPAAPGTGYKVGSVTKLFTAVSVMQLKEAGKLTLDSPLGAYLPDFVIKSRFHGAGPVTLHNVLSHHSGLPSDLLSLMCAPSLPSSAQTVALLKEEYLAFPPDYIFSYSNVGYLLLGEVIAQVSGMSYQQYVKSKLLEPLAMNRTGFEPAAGATVARYQGAKGPQLNAPPAAGGLYSDVLDLSRFMLMVLAGGSLSGQRILSSSALQEMLLPQTTPLDLDIKIGLGWFLGGQDLNYAGRIASHGGAIKQYYSQLTMLPEHKLGVVVLTAGAGATAAEEISTAALRLALEEKTGLKPPVPEKSKAIAAIPEQMQKYRGHYATSAGLLEIKPGRGGLYTSLGGVPIRLVPLADGSFAPKYNLWGLFAISVPQLANLKFSFQDLAGHQALILETKGDKFIYGEKITPTPLPEVWQRRLGSYQSLNRDGSAFIRDVTLGEEAGFLTFSGFLEGVGKLKVALLPLTEKLAIIRGLGRNAGDAVSFQDDDVMRYSGYLFKKSAVRLNRGCP